MENTQMIETRDRAEIQSRAHLAEWERPELHRFNAPDAEAAGDFGGDIVYS